ncbi:substrate-binding domain-containing protein [Streptomyces griseofuscus]|uniref:4,5-dihydroxyphthalate decarboxylase n=1 Tax=Streptomyces griseofuscus TaxID=146922 RepID=UPI003829C8D9
MVDDEQAYLPGIAVIREVLDAYGKTPFAEGMTTLSMATGRYDTTQALFDGSVGVEGAQVTMQTEANLSKIFERVLRRAEFDVAELGWTFYLRSFGPDSPYVALPIFPNRVFRQSCVFVNRTSGITRPEDLVGRTIGEWGVYGQDSGVWAKGILADEYGFRPQANRWVIGGLDAPAEPFGFVPQIRPDGIDITDAPAGTSLAGLLESGEIDALFTANVPQSVLDGSAKNIVRLFEDFEAVERDYYCRTGIYPMMHPVVIRRDRLGLARAVFDGFQAAKQAAEQRYAHARRLFGATLMLPWASRLMDENAKLFSGDWWPYGTEANRHTVDTFLRYHYDQGLSERRLTVDEVFTPGF